MKNRAVEPGAQVWNYSSTMEKSQSFDSRHNECNCCIFIVHRTCICCAEVQVRVRYCVRVLVHSRKSFDLLNPTVAIVGLFIRQKWMKSAFGRVNVAMKGCVNDAHVLVYVFVFLDKIRLYLYKKSRKLKVFEMKQLLKVNSNRILKF